MFGDTDEKSAKEGDSVTLDSGFTELMDHDFIQWLFIPENKDAIVVADSYNVYKDAAGGRFGESLKVDQKTGSLTITNIRPEHAGSYGLITTSVFKSFNLIVSGELIISFTCFIYCSFKEVFYLDVILSLKWLNPDSFLTHFLSLMFIQ